MDRPGKRLDKDDEYELIKSLSGMLRILLEFNQEEMKESEEGMDMYLSVRETVDQVDRYYP